MVKINAISVNCRDWVLDIITRNSKAGTKTNVETLRERQKFNSSSIATALRKLVEEGLIEKIDRGIFQIKKSPN